MGQYYRPLLFKADEENCTQDSLLNIWEEARYKGLGSSDPKVLREIIMDPKTRRIFRVDASDVNIMKTYDMLIGRSKDAVQARKEMIMNFEWKPSDIDT